MLQDQIGADLVAAMKAKDALRVEVFRGLKAAFVNELVATKRMPTDPLPDEDAVTVLKREVKKRKEAADAFRGGNRAELAAKEDAERVILEAYLPETMPKAEILKFALAKKLELGLTDKKEMGKFMGLIMKELGGKADGADVRDVVAGLFL
ncbi:GatB/YqeY domain-containing protein [Patescibacteria group bacterium]|nr:GatB/YqeY domain-containing protein [Patescibacteria group bacterium]